MDERKEADRVMQTLWKGMHSKGLTFESLGKLSGVCPETIRSWYRGNATPSLLFIIPVLHSLGLTMKFEKE